MVSPSSGSEFWVFVSSAYQFRKELTPYISYKSITVLYLQIFNTQSYIPFNI